MDKRRVFCAGAIARPVLPLPQSAPCQAAVDRFKSDPALAGLPLADATGAIVSLADRQRLLAALADPLHASVYLKRPTRLLAETDFLAVDFDTPLADVVEMIHARHPRALSAGVVVMRADVFAGHIAPLALMESMVEQTRADGEALEEARATAERANRAKGVFLATMSHEIRTPLAGVVANLELLNLTRLTAEQSELARSADSAAAALMSLIGDILDFSKIEAERLEFEAVAFEPRALLREAVDLMRARAASKKLALDLRIDPNLPEVSIGDPTRLRQIALNFLSNAVKFTERGSVRVAARGFQEGGRDWLRLAVHDTGIGFDPMRAAQLFTPFRQAEQSTTRRFGGTGLGLAICHRLAVLMDGRAFADSAPDDGASFVLEVPAAVAVPPKPVDTRALAGRFVALLGGDPLWRGRMAAALYAAGAAARELLPADLAGIGARDFAGILTAPAPDDPAPPTPTLDPALPHLRVLHADTLAARREALRAGAWDWVARDASGARAVDCLAGLLARPVEMRVPESAAKPADLALAAKGLRVLVADDVAMNREIVGKQLARLGLTADFAADGDEALALANPARHALVLCDVSMPNRDGYGFVRALRAHEAQTGARRLPVVALTALAMAGDDQQARDAGMDDYLTKPVKLDRLAATLARWLVAAPAAAGEEAVLPPRKAPPIDLAALAEMLGSDEPGTLADMLGMFAAQILDSAAALEAASDAPALRARIHQIKGCAANIGASSLRAAAAALETEAITGAAARPAIEALTAHARAIAAHACAEAERLTREGAIA